MTKTNKMAVRPAKTQISLGIRPVRSVFDVRMKEAWDLSYPLSAERRLWSDWADAQADLSLRWAHSFCWFCRVVAHYEFVTGNPQKNLFLSKLIDETFCLSVAMASVMWRQQFQNGANFTFLLTQFVLVSFIPDVWLLFLDIVQKKKLKVSSLSITSLV